MDPLPIILQAVRIKLDGPEFNTITRWPFADPFVSRLLRTDIPERIGLGMLQIWSYWNSDGDMVGFGTIDLANDHAKQTGGLVHPYIPLLAINPTIASRGYGTSILQHIIVQSAIMSHKHRCISDLYLDVYITSVKAIALYEKLGFVRVNSDPIPDLKEGELTYNIMVRRSKAISAGLPLAIPYAGP